MFDSNEIMFYFPRLQEAMGRNRKVVILSDKTFFAVVSLDTVVSAEFARVKGENKCKFIVNVMDADGGVRSLTFISTEFWCQESLRKMQQLVMSEANRKQKKSKRSCLGN
jgi:hypothetical protein